MVPSIAQLPPSPSITKSSSSPPITTRAALESTISSLSLTPLWASPVTSPEPHTAHIPAVWHYSDTKNLLLRAAELVDPREAERRAVLMVNPGPKRPPFTLDTILAAHQLILPGEKAVCHRHTPFAVRFLIEGSSGYTAISGKKMFMKPGDLIITPVWNWHDHGNDGIDNVIWMDGLNIPIFKHIPVDFTTHYVDEYGVETHASAVVPDEEAAEMKFPWKSMAARLDSQEGDHACAEYKLPNGDSVSTTVGAYAHRIKAGGKTVRVRETASYCFQVHGGKGRTEFEGLKGEKVVLRWGKGDTFCVPSWWSWVNFAEGDERVYLFSFGDKPMLEKLGFWREEILS